MRQRVTEAGGVDVRAFGLREKAMWDESNFLRDFAEINYTGELPCPVEEGGGERLAMLDGTVTATTMRER